MAGQIQDDVFILLCRLDDFDLTGNWIDDETLPGWLACNHKVLRELNQIDVSGNELKGASSET